MALIYDVQSAIIRVLRSNPPQIIVWATGRTASTGWANPQLEPYVYIDAPPDGIQDFEFTADPPNFSLPVLTPISADAAVTRDPANYWGKEKPLVGVRIRSRTNSIEQKLEAGSEQFLPMGEGLPLPWPIPWRRLEKMGPYTGGGG
ncbi:hypothetical protein SAMN05216573_12254 [Bradyrhizobium sp. Rc3b]|uniref:hypothetical protein n=1 Tax=Bradyrhizobium sp. Rc3b TaxID=1855322 RepID=UPI0008F08405|nr:hypothetical protein [Bradyrhizobium sp. Rc3b]SFN80765.1 hypothetical protein SAMN05216573_12254 [Bradyrhizobium sp. Rc3b]